MPDSGSGVKMSPDLPMRLLATFWHRGHVPRTVSFFELDGVDLVPWLVS